MPQYPRDSCLMLEGLRDTAYTARGGRADGGEVVDHLALPTRNHFK